MLDFSLELHESKLLKLKHHSKNKFNDRDQSELETLEYILVKLGQTPTKVEQINFVEVDR